MTPTKPDTVKDSGTPKKHYEAPRLEIYGDIHQITQAVGTHGKADGGPRLKNKTG